jgi:predicted nucleotidyltransferase
MGVFQEIKSEAQQRKLNFLVIGGLAVVFHGFTRDTADLDLLIRQDDRSPWLDLLTHIGYTVKMERHAFFQFDPPNQGAWPVDLMLVRNETFEPMHAAGSDVEMYGAMVRIPSLEHLLALKLHVLKHGHAGRYHKDLLDVEALVRANAVDLRSDKMRRIFLKYGSEKIYEQISRFTASGQQP